MENRFEAWGHPPDESLQETCADAAVMLRGIMAVLREEAEASEDMALKRRRFFSVSKLASAAIVLEELSK